MTIEPITAKIDWLKSEQQNTTSGERNGDLDAALAAEGGAQHSILAAAQTIPSGEKEAK